MIKADVTYPDKFPSPLLASNTRKRGATFDRSNADTGLAAQRKGFEFQMVQMDFSIVCTHAQAWLFENFFKVGLDNGMKWFNLKRKTPRGYIEQTVRFTEMYKYTAIAGGLYSYTCSIEVFNNVN